MHDFEAEERAAKPAARQDRAIAVEGRGLTPVGSEAMSVLDLQRMAGNAGVVRLLKGDADEEQSPVHDVVGRGGSSLDAPTRTAMERRFGTDFGDVRVHTDAQASRSAEAVGANAYTVGTDIVFRSGHFNPGSLTGQRTLAHELSHVIQQKRGPVDGSDAPGGIRVSDPGDRFERAAEATATAITAVPIAKAAAPPSTQLESDGSEDGASTLQRQMSEEEDEEAESG
jgi:hypothetical protein